MRQYSLFPNKQRHFYGGEITKGCRKEMRPLCRKRPIHIVLKGQGSLRKHRDTISQQVKRSAGQFGLRLNGLALAGDHVHLIVKIPSRREYLGFIRSLTGLLA